MASPLLLFDRKQLRDFDGIAGVDEAGRGALAGPVVAAAVWVSPAFYAERRIAYHVGGINDSKQLSAERRTELAARIRQWEAEGRLTIGVGSGSVLEIASLNILGATRAAMDRALRCLAEHGVALPAAERDTPLWGESQSQSAAKILVDGRPLRPFSWQHTAIVEGDGKSLAIAMASIIAKTTRDALMRELGQAFPQYGFAEHKGYGTQAHRDALTRLGPCAHHRSLFLRKLEAAQTAPEQVELF